MFSGIKELINNFINPVIDNNVIDIEISDDNFTSIAMASGMSAEDISLLQKTRNGIQLITKRAKKVEEKQEERPQIEVVRNNKEKEQGREPGE